MTLVSLDANVKALILKQDYLAQAIAWVESRWNPKAVSPAGAKGLFQLMPAICKTFDVKDPFDPVESLRGYNLLMDEERDRFGEIELAVAAYNSGSPNVKRAIEKAKSRRFDRIKPFLPIETQLYVPKVSRAVLKAVAGELPE